MQVFSPQGLFARRVLNLKHKKKDKKVNEFLAIHLKTGSIVRRQCNVIRGGGENGNALHIPAGLRRIGKLLIDRKRRAAQEVTQKQGARPTPLEASVPVGGGEEKDFVGVERFALHQKCHVRHVLVVQEVRI